MRRFRPEHLSRHAGLLCVLPALLLCAATLAGCRFGTTASFFDEDAGIEKAVAMLREQLGSPVRALNLSMAPDRITIRVQDPSNRSHIDEWRLDRMQFAGFGWDRVSGPLPYQLTLVNPDLEANLFELDEVDFTAAATLARTAVERAALAGPARATHMEIARRVFVLPSPSSGEIRWTLDVNSADESVQVFADARGAIVGINIDGTSRAKNLDIFKQLDLIGDAAQAFRFILGPDRILTRVTVNSRAIGFETNISDPNAPIPVSGSLTTRRTYTWNLNGLQRVLPTIKADAALAGARSAPFSVDDVDWRAAPKIIAAAVEQLAMPQGHISAIEVFKPDNPLGPSAVLWKVEITDQNKDTGFVLADVGGAVKQVMPPQSRRKAVDYYDPATIAETFAKLGVDFGQDRQYAEITFLGDKVIITAQDHMQPNSLSQIILTDGAFQRVGTPAMSAVKNVPFRISDLSALKPDRIRDLEANTLNALKLPPNSISGITIGRGSMDPSPNGNVTIEIRAEERPGGRAGRINYELDGTVIRAYLP